MPDFNWTEDQVDLLKKLWGEGLSAGQVAGILGGGLSRSAVIGKVHRLKLPGRAKAEPSRAVRAAPSTRERQRASTTRHHASSRPQAAAAPVFDPAPLPVEDAVDVTGLIGLIELTEQTCKYPIGDPLLPTFGFCGRQSVEGKPYCDFHQRRTHQTVQQSRAAAEEYKAAQRVLRQ